MRRASCVLLLALASAACGEPRVVPLADRVGSAPVEDGTPPPAMDDAGLIGEIRRKIMASTTFSAAAQKVEVSAEDGVVTLRGSVENEREKAELVAIARDAAGEARVRDQLEIAKR
jgi:osmotically-inducible protein OsmY